MQSTRVPRGTKPTKTQSNSCWGCFRGMGSGQRWQWPDRDGSSSPQPHSHGAAGLPSQAKLPKIAISNKTLAHLGRETPESRRVSAPGICIPGFLPLPSLTKETAREGGEPLPPTPFSGRNPCVNMTPSPREQGQWCRLCPPDQPAFLPPSPGNPPFVGSSRPCERAVCRPAF